VPGRKHSQRKSQSSEEKAQSASVANEVALAQRKL